MIDETPTTPPGTPKPARESVTLWLDYSALAFVALALAIPEVMALIPAEWRPVAVAIVLILNLYLRTFVTSQPIKR